MEKKYQEIKDSQVHSIKYVNDPEVAKQYHELFLMVIQRINEEEMIKQSQ